MAQHNSHHLQQHQQRQGRQVHTTDQRQQAANRGQRRCAQALHHISQHRTRLHPRQYSVDNQQASQPGDGQARQAKTRQNRHCHQAAGSATEQP